MVSTTYDTCELSVLKELNGLYEKDPDLFEERSRELISMTIESFPEDFKTRARGIQFRLELELNKIKDPVSRLNLMIELFWENFSQFQRILNDPMEAIEESWDIEPRGKVIPFPRQD